MKRLATATLIVLALTLVAGQPALSTDKIGSRLNAVMNASSSGDEIVAWVYFADKGSHELMKSAVPRSVVSERSLRRRMKVRAENELVDYTDLPVEERYVDEVTARVIRLRQRSKWFNSVSVVATKDQISELQTFPFVSSIELVARWPRSYDSEEGTDAQEGGTLPPTLKPEGVNDLNYGGSLNQVQMVNVPNVHNTGNYAQGVLVCVLDNGVRLLNHQAFDSMSIIAMYDFVDHKVSVVPNNTNTGFGSHGVNTLSLIGGYKPGTLIGPAFGADFILARTENDSSETPVEEDNWAAAIEWADSIGVDVTSTSLGYLDYDFPYPSWTWEDMDGNSTVITRAADMAVARGIVVLNSAGNNGSNPSRNTLGAPADGDSVLAVGALISSGTRASYSSVGPTTGTPARIKPDIMAQGSNPVYASGSNPTVFSSSGGGTSYSCPIAAGVAALVINARPNASAMQVINALKATASNAGTPNNLIGWGTIDAVAAINYISPTDTHGDGPLPTAYHLDQNYPNPFNPRTTIRYTVGGPSLVTLKVYDLLGREVKTLVNEQQFAKTHSAVWDGTDHKGQQVASGMYLYRLSAISNTGSTFIEARAMMFLK
jgi:hypothetical protein